MNKKTLVVVAVIFGIILFAVGFTYATHSADSLPHFFPGFSANDTQVHVKHSIAAFVVGIALFVYAWFQSAPKKTT